MAGGYREQNPDPEGVRPELVSAEDGVELVRGLLEWTGWSQAQLATVLRRAAGENGLPAPGVDAVTVNRWVKGRQRPTQFYVRLLLALLERLLASAARDPHLAARLDAVNRREFLLRLAGATGASAVVPAAAAGLVPRLAAWLAEPDALQAAQVEPTVEYLRRVLNELVTADWLLGPRLQLPTVASHYQLLERVLAIASGAAHRDVLELRTRYAEFAAWLHEDSGQSAAVAWWIDQAAESALEARDELMTSYLLVQKSRQAATERDARRTIEFAQAAQRASSVTPKIRACALQQEAYGLALAGEELECERKLDRALELSARKSDLDEQGPARFCIPQFVENWRATCLLELGQALRAAEAFENALAALPVVHHRDRGVYLGRLAVAYATMGVPEAAVLKGGEALQIARTTRSSHVVEELRRLRQKLRPWRTWSTVSDFDRAFLGIRSS